MGKIKKPKKGTVCTALINEDYDYHLSGDTERYCTCAITNERCIGMEIDDPDDQSSQFFSRARNIPSQKKLLRCPAYNCSKEIVELLVKGRMEIEMSKRLENIKN